MSSGVQATGEAGVAAIEELAGRVPRRAIRAGTVVQKEWLEAPRLVQRGETVKVQVVSGLTKLETEGIAEASERWRNNLRTEPRFETPFQGPGGIERSCLR